MAQCVLPVLGTWSDPSCIPTSASTYHRHTVDIPLTYRRHTVGIPTTLALFLCLSSSYPKPQPCYTGTSRMNTLQNRLQTAVQPPRPDESRKPCRHTDASFPRPVACTQRVPLLVGQPVHYFRESLHGNTTQLKDPQGPHRRTAAGPSPRPNPSMCRVVNPTKTCLGAQFILPAAP